ncbi:hypothetical protein HPB50_026142 [Hyalomma asiaticum]|uniref:Uncharacterized protein n=1 Tax=Hyalomma asiaticum TaxID=266040 RepID=A0ACB7S9T8_HYAAI|nr:hypothetical protein HPB50_026142 [Hyalomma asiaticum]
MLEIALQKFNCLFSCAVRRHHCTGNVTTFIIFITGGRLIVCLHFSYQFFKRLLTTDIYHIVSQKQIRSEGDNDPSPSRDNIPITIAPTDPTDNRKKSCACQQ